ncbi:MAG: hypothetical protein M1828_005707 [Chrysothrix sp. TS-e1954]|nr:MAG: hypothetical protein M1828_005707 [Chrysothrix sp. TS-e1954]
MATQKLAGWALSLKYSDLPQSVRHAALRSTYNYLGCAIYGSAHPAVTKAHNALEPFFGKSTSSLLGHRGSGRVDAQHAALLNGIASHVHDYDDTHLETIIHPTGPVASALLAFAEYRGSTSGEDFLLALTVGIEAECKVGLAVWPSHYDIGWHITSTVGSIGAAVAVGKLMGLGREALQHAIGIAAVQVTGLREMFGSDTKSFHPGRAAQSGLLAALLAEKGYTSSLEALEAKRGWANVVVGGGQPQLDKYLAELGSVWEIEKNAFKPFPCGIVCHPVIDACIKIHNTWKVRGKDPKLELQDKKVDARVHPLVIELTSKRLPRDGLEGKFSVYHGAAVGLLLGKAGPAQYEDEIVRDAAIIKVRDSIEAISHQDIRSNEAVVRVLGDEILEMRVEHAIGSVEVPMSDKQLTEKFIDQVSLFWKGSAASEASKRCWQLASLQDIADLARAI